MHEGRRRNGWSWPPSFRQILCWLIILFILPLTAFMFVPLHVFYAPLVIGVVAVWIVVLVVLLTTIDPAYSRVYTFAKAVHFDASKHAHVIEKFYCNVCQIHV
ncbi:unnamed protein product [Enterobius vermicularis]|uniref:Inner membrane protein n=1 Tax=Enterobius vermicularis TaxID=51028 RepID=A0A0N4VNJ1_ENTVE|nr:unnamed protein product [Enterobius vermicularis]